MNRADLQLKLVMGSYSAVKCSRLLNFAWGRRFFVQSYFWYKRYLEDPFYHLIRQHPGLLRGGNVMDMGVNVGYTSTLFARGIDQDFRVYAFECEDLNYALLTEMLRPIESRFLS